MQEYSMAILDSGTLVYEVHCSTSMQHISYINFL